MPLSKQHKERTREEILAAAGTLFRAHGYHGVGIDTIMAEAGLTRGGFYAHFKSKAALFDEILRTDHGILRRLRERDEAATTPMPEQANQILHDYLEPVHLDFIKAGCTFAALAGDVAKGQAHSRQEFGHAIHEYLAELRKGMNDTPETARKTILTTILSIGAVMISSATDDKELVNDILLTSQAEVEKLMTA